MSPDKPDGADLFAGDKSLGLVATALARVMDASKQAEGLASRDGARSRYYSLPDGRTLRVSDHRAKPGNTGSVAHVDVVLDAGASVEVCVNTLDALGVRVTASESVTLDAQGDGQSRDINGKAIAGWCGRREGKQHAVQELR